MQAVDISDIHLYFEAVGHCQFTKGIKEVEEKRSTNMEQVLSYFEMELFGESLMKVIT